MDRNSVSKWTGRVALVFLAVVFVLLGAGSAMAQVDTGSILGTVRDESGGSVAGATVTLVNEGTNATLATTTSADGAYKFSPVRIGTYKLSATTKGFQTTTQTGVIVNVTSEVLVDFSLKPGNVTETVEVSAAPPVLESQNASVGQVMDTRSVNDLPLNGRNFTFLAQLGAGVNTPQADTRGNAASGAFSANGNRPAQNNYMLDGIDNNSDTVDFLNGTNFVVLPPVDAVDEFKVETTGFSAQYGRSGAAVLNATIKSGTNSLHGAAWEFFRNDVLDAADFFENAGQIPKGALRQNQFGASIGGPVVIPHIINGRNKLFFFADYEGLRRVQGTIFTSSVPTAAERSSGYTDFSDLITGQSNSAARPDALGRLIPVGTILDPATTRSVTAGAIDPVSGLPALSTGYARDPIGTNCAPSTLNYGAASGCTLNQIPLGRLDTNAINLLNLYPNPTTSSLFNNYASSPKLYEHRNAFDARMDGNFSERDQLFFRFSLADDPQFIPGPFAGIADGGAFKQGLQTANAQQTALGYTHTFSPTVVNVARIGFNYLHTTRLGPEADNLTDLPGQFGIQDIPQVTENGGLPTFGINGLTNLGSSAFLPSDEISSTFQATDDFTKIYGKHTFKAGIEYQHVKFSTLQPGWSRGEFDFNGNNTDIPGVYGGNTGRADFLLIPQTTSLLACGTCVDYTGGPSEIRATNITLTDNGKNYYGLYGNDDWKVSQKLTINLGLRWDYFGLIFEHHGAQANLIPNGAPLGGPLYIIPSGPNQNTLSPSFLSTLAADGITLAQTDVYGKGLGNSQPHNFAPRVGFAYQVTPKFVARGGFGLFYNGFENRGYGPSLSENYPFQYNFDYVPTNPQALPIFFTTAAGGPCTAAGPSGLGNATLETGFACTPLDPLLVNATGLGLHGIQFNYSTPYTMSGNFTLQYQLTPSMSIQAAYVMSLSRHLEVFAGMNQVTQVLPANANRQAFVQFPDLGYNLSYAQTEGNSGYNGLQLRAEKKYAAGFNFLATYTWSKTISDSFDLLNGGVGQGYRAPQIPGFGIQGDYGLANFDIRNVFHFSGGYELPFGKGKHFASNATGFEDKLVGGWSVNWILTLQDGQPITLTCPSAPAAGVGCNDYLIGKPKLGLHTDSNGKLSWYGNNAAWAQPCLMGGTAAAPVPIPNSPTGCIPENTLLDALGGGTSQVPGPGFHRLDFSVFKDIPINERFRLQFRTEIFNITNHPNFNAPNFGGNGVVAVGGSGDFTSSNFGEIGSTRDNPYDARQIQFALKLYY
jgi:hypothetical protein